MSLIPLITRGGGGGSGGRPLGLPAMQSSPPPNPAAYYEDFITCSIGATGQWNRVDLAGTNTAGIIPGTGTTSAGQCRIATGTGASDAALVETVGLSSTNSGIFTLPSSPPLVQSRFNWMARFSFGSTLTNMIAGVGLIENSIATGTDWLTDPDTTFAANRAVLIHRSTSAYSGDAAGDLILRSYDGVTALSTVLLASASVASTPIKVELSYTYPTITAWVNGTSVGTLAWDYGGSHSLRPSFGVKNLTGASHQINMDTLYAEWGLTAAR